MALDPTKEIQRMVAELGRLIQGTKTSTEAQAKVNSELLKVIALLRSGLETNSEEAENLILDVQEGLKVTDEYAKKWALNRKAQKKDLDKIEDQFRDIKDHQEDLNDFSKEFIKNLDGVTDSLETEFDLTKKLLGSYGNLSKIIAESKNVANQFSGTFGQVDDTLKTIISRRAPLSKVFSGMFDSSVVLDGTLEKIQSDIEALMESAKDSFLDIPVNFDPNTSSLDETIESSRKAILDEFDMRNKSLEEYFSKNKDLQKKASLQAASKLGGGDIQFDIDTSQLKVGTKILFEGTQEYQEIISKLESIIDDNDIGKNIQESFSEINRLIALGIDKTEEQYSRLDDLLIPLDLASKMMVEQFTIEQSLLQGKVQELDIEKNKLIIVQKNLNSMYAMESIVTKIGANFDYINSILPSGVGNFLGLSKVSLQLLEAHKKGVDSFLGSLTSGATKSEAMVGYWSELSPVLGSLMNPITLVIGGALLLFSIAKDLVAKYKEISQEMGVSILQAKEQYQVQLDILTSQKNQFATMQDIRDVQTSMIAANDGKMFDLNTKGAKELTIQLVEAGKVFGYGTDEAVKMAKVFSNIGASDELGMRLQQDIGLMSEAAGISPQIISKDLIESADTVSTYFAGLPDKAAKAVIQIHRMGMSLKQAGEIAQKMLDLEGFMTDMYELQAMTGGGIDFSNAFDKGLMGDIAGMTEDIMNDIGTTAEYNKMDFLTRTKIAKTLGISVDDLGKSVRLHEQMAGFSGKEGELLKANVDRMGDISNLSKDQIRDRLQQLQSTDRLEVAWSKIKGVLASALVPLAEAFASVIDGISPILDVVIMLLKGAALIIKALAPLVKGVLAPLKFVGDILTGILGYIDKFFGKVSSGSSILSGFSDIIYGIGVAIGGWFALTSAPKFFSWIMSAIGSIFKIIPGIGSLFTGLTNSVGSMLGLVSKKSSDAAVATSDPMKSAAESMKVSFTAATDHMKAEMTGVADHIKMAMSSVNATTSAGIDSASVSTTKSTATMTAKAVESTKIVAIEAEKSAIKIKSAMKSTETSTIQSLDNIQKKGKSGFISSKAVGPVFKTIGAIGAAAFAKMAVEGSMSFLHLKKDGTDAISGIAESSMPIFQMAFAGVGSMLTNHLSDAVSRVFTKKIEKSITEKLEDPIKKATKSFSSLGKEGKGVFGKIGDYGKGILGKITGKGSNLMEEIVGDTSVATQATKSLDTIVDKKTTIEDQVKTKKSEIVESSTKSGKIKEPKFTQVKSGFSKLSDFISGAWDTLRKVLMDIVKFATGVLKEISSGIGTAIKNILKGVADGLNSFKTSAIKGAAALLIVSGAIWVTSKAFQNFSTVSWSDVAKGLVSIGALAGIALLLGKASSDMILGSIAIAILGASLIPAAYALNMFNDVDWSSLAKAGVALLGLGVIAGIMGSMVPLMLLGAVGIAALGASLIPMAYAMQMFNKVEWDGLAKAGTALVGFGLIAAGFGSVAPLILAGALTIGVASVSLLAFAGSIYAINLSMKGLDIKPLKELAGGLLGLMDISIMQLMGISGAITSIGMSMLAFNTLSSIGSVIGKLFGGDSIKDLERLGNLADPLYLVNNVIGSLANSLTTLTEVLANIDLTNLSKLKEIGNSIDLGKFVQDQVEPMIKMQKESVEVQRDSIRISPVQSQIAKVKEPKRESVAQDIKINNIVPGQKSESKEDPYKPENQTKSQPVQSENQSVSDIYNRPNNESLLNQLIMLQRQANALLEAFLMKESVVKMDGQKVGIVQKKYNNNA